MVSPILKKPLEIFSAGMLEYLLELSLPDGTAVRSTTNVWVLPRKKLA